MWVRLVPQGLFPQSASKPSDEKEVANPGKWLLFTEKGKFWQ